MEHCPLDGSPLADAAPAEPLPCMRKELPSPAPVEETGEIKSLIFKFCSKCRASFAGGLDICPEDGTHLSERSAFLARKGGCVHGALDPLLQLKKFCPHCKTSFPLHKKVCPGCGSALLIPTLGAGEGGPAREAGALLLIAEKYRIIQDIGVGGFGSVYLAKHELLGKRFALKMLRSQLSGSPAFRDRFHEEALKLSRLEDENIVKVIDFGEWQDFQYMVTEYVEGRDLSKLIYAETMDPLRAARIARQVAGALAEAHSKKIVHLDLKPANILVAEKRGRDLVKVIDFGIAEIFSEGRERRQEEVAGTSTYMAPEQWRQEPIDPRSDIYSFGVILFECLAARPPFREDRLDRIQRAHCEESPPPLRKVRPEVPVDLEKLVARCLEKDPAKRIQSAEEIEAILEDFVWRRESKLLCWARRAGMAAAAALVLVAAAWGLREAFRDRDPPVWNRVEVTAGGRPVVEVDRTEVTRRYRTREGAVRVDIVAQDRRGVEKVVVSRGGREDSIPGASAAIDLDSLPVGTTDVSARAVDRSGNPSKTMTVTIERLGPPVCRARLDRIPQRTRQESVELEIEELQGARAVVTCRSGDELLFQKEVDAASATVAIPLKQGKAKPAENVISVRAKGSLSPGDVDLPARSWTVMCLKCPLALETDVRADPADKVLKMKPGEWLAGSARIDLVLLPKRGGDRLEEKVTIRCRTAAKATFLDWAPDGSKDVCPIDLAPGKNQVDIEPFVDSYGNEFPGTSIIVHSDPDPPEIKVHTEIVEDYSKGKPVVRFSIADRYPAPRENDMELFAISPAGEERPVREFSVSKVEGDIRELRLLDGAMPEEDESYRFRIAARDLIGNRTGKDAGSFTVVRDHDPPAVDIVSVPGEPLRRGDRFEVKVRMRHVSAEGLQVRAEVRVSGQAGGVSVFRLEPDAAGATWMRTFSIAKGAAKGDVVKPAAFPDDRPRIEVSVTALDRAGHASKAAAATFPFAWENGDRLMWSRDRSTLVYHDDCPAWNAPAFWMAEREVTNGQYRAFLDSTRKEAAAPRSPDWKDGRLLDACKDLPVRGITVREMKAYAAWAGLEVPRLIQWKVAAFWNYQGSERAYPWGPAWPGAPLPIRCGVSPKDGPVAGGRAEHEAGKTPPPFFLEHMYGNVWEAAIDDEKKGIVQVGGAFDTKPIVFKGEGEFGKFLRGREIALDYSEENLGFRCIRARKETRP